MIKAVIFDAGGVLIEDKKLLARFIEIFKPRSIPDFWRDLNRLLEPLCKGDITQAEYWQRMARLYDIDPRRVPPDLWLKDYAETTTVRKNMLQLVQNIRKNYTTILVSNTIEPHARINRARGLFQDFDDVLNSYEVQLTKHTSEIFHLALARNDLDPENCIFIDDVIDFVEIARSIGIHGILFENHGQLTSVLASLGVRF